MKSLSRVYRTTSNRRKSSVAKPRKKVTPERQKSPRETTQAVHVGIWDLGAWVGYLDRILDQWNACQTRFRFQQVLLSVPFQLTQGGARTEETARSLLDPRQLKRDADALRENLFIGGIESIARKIQKDLQYDQLVSITPYMIAFIEDDRLKYNYYSLSYNGIIFVSAYEMREYALKAKRPFEAAIGSLILGQVLADRSDELDFHTETRGCLFDFNEERYTVVQSFKKMEIEPSCLSLVPEDLRPAAVRMTKALSDYRRK
jgi:hypothetical protein